MLCQKGENAKLAGAKVLAPGLAYAKSNWVYSGRFGPFQGLGLARLILSHSLISGLQSCLNNVRTNQIFNEAADSPRTNDFAPGGHSKPASHGHLKTGHLDSSLV